MADRSQHRRAGRHRARRTAQHPDDRGQQPHDPAGADGGGRACTSGQSNSERAPSRGSRDRQAPAGTDNRFVSSNWLRRTLNTVYPDHWSFVLGQIAIYSFIVLLLSGRCRGAQDSSSTGPPSLLIANRLKASRSVVIARRPLYPGGGCRALVWRGLAQCSGRSGPACEFGTLRFSRPDVYELITEN